MFDINDFDETLPGPWEWDVKRLAASFAIAGRGNGFPEKVRTDIVRAACASYREQMRRYADMRTLEVWYAHADMAEVEAEEAEQLDERGRARLSRTIAQARTHDTVQAYRKLTRRSGGQVRIAADPPLIVPLDDLLPDIERDQLVDQIHAMVQGYGRSLRSDHRFYCWSSTGSSTWRARSSGSAVWAPAAGSCCCSARTWTTRCCCRRRRRTSPYSPPTPERAPTPTRANASWPVSG